MSTNIRWLVAALLVAGLLLAAAVPGQAQGRPEALQAAQTTPTASPEATLEPTTVLTEVLTAAPPTEPALEEGVNAVELKFSDWGYSDVALNGPVGSASYDLGLPAHWEIQPGGLLTLNMDYTESLGTNQPALLGTPWPFQEALANLQVLLNGEQIHQANLSPGKQSLQIPLPDVWPPRTGERDRLEVILTVYGPCEYAIYRTLRIFSDSTLDLTYREGQLNLDLADFPAPFYQRTFLPAQALMVMPDQASADETAAGLAVAAGLGSKTQNRVALEVIPVQAFDPANPPLDNLIVVGTPENNPLIAELAASPDLPMSLRSRRLALAANGPTGADPGERLAYTFEASNPETSPAAGLSLVARFPAGVANPACTPDCQLEAGQAVWDLGSMEPGALAAFTLDFDAPSDDIANSLMVSADLLQEGEPINGVSLRTTAGAQADAPNQRNAPASPYLFVQDGRVVPDTDGILMLVPSPWHPGRAVLLVTGLNSAAVTKAGQAIAMNARFPGLLGQAMSVEEIQPLSPDQVAPPQQFTLAELGYHDQVVTGGQSVVGTGPKEIFYQFDLPLGWVLSEDASVALKFSHSALLDPEQSSLTVMFNDQPVATTALDESNALNGVLVASLPADAARPGRANALRVQALLMMPDPCADPLTSGAWLNIASSSSINLDHRELFIPGALADLDLWPLPFVSSPDLSDVSFVLPQSPTAAEYTAAARTAAYLGAGAAGSGFQPGASLGESSPANLANRHLILIGRPSRNPLLQQINTALPQPFEPGSDGIRQQVDRMVVGLPAGLDLGYLQALVTPWDPNRVALVVTGTSDPGMQQAADVLVDSGQNWQLKGNLALMRDEQIHILDTVGLTQAGRATAIATVVPEAAVVGPITSTPAAAASQATPGAAQAAEPGVPPPTYPQRYPLLIPVVIGVTLLVVLFIALLAIRQARRRDKF